MLNALLTVALLHAAPDPGNLSPEVERYLASARQLYETLDFELALKQAQRAKEHAHSGDDDCAIGLYEGIFLGELGRGEESDQAFRLALSLKPEAQLPVKVSPKITEHFEAVRALMPRQKPAPVPVPPVPIPEPQLILPPSPPVVVIAPPNRILRQWSWIPAVGGAAFTTLTVISVIGAADKYNQLTGPRSAGPIDPTKAATLVAEGKSNENGAVVWGILAVASLTTTAYMFWSGPSPAPAVQVGATLTPGGAGIAVGGTLP